MNRTMGVALGSLIAVYALNVAANAIYKAATQERTDLLRERIERLARIDPKSREISHIRQLVARADYGTFTTALPIAIARGSALATYLNNHPHLSLGVAVDGEGPTPRQTIDLLKIINQRLGRHRISIGLAEPIVAVKLSRQATRDDVFHGITTAFRRRPDYHLAFTSRTCSYASSGGRAIQPRKNRLYTFGLKGLTVVDGATTDGDLVKRLVADITGHLKGDRQERRWRNVDYNQRADDILSGHKILGRVVRQPRRRELRKGEDRIVRVTVGLDHVPREDARAYFNDANSLFETYGIRYRIGRFYQHHLDDNWNWPIEIKKMQERGSSDLYVLLTATEWNSPRRGHLRGLGSALYGAIMVQVGTHSQTAKRLTHELGHMFGLARTFLRGHVMYPNESGIGLRWSPGSDRLLRENRLSASWHSVTIYPQRFQLAVKLAPPITRPGKSANSAHRLTPLGPDDAWMKCT